MANIYIIEEDIAVESLQNFSVKINFVDEESFFA